MGWCGDLACPEELKAAVGWVRESGLHWQPGAWGRVGETPAAQAVGAVAPGSRLPRVDPQLPCAIPAERHSGF